MAAGLGFKDFVTGEVLTAADVDGYLMQGVWVFASAAARDAAVTSPQEGNFAYLKDTNVTTYYTGSAWANLDTTGMTNPMTTTGDTIYSSSGSTPARLGIGSTGNVLTVSGGVPTWAAPATGGGMTLLSTTTLSGASTTISSIDQTYKNLTIVGKDIYVSTTGQFQLEINADTGSDYALTNINGNGTTAATSANENTAGVFVLGYVGTDNTYSKTGNFDMTIPRYSETEYHPFNHDYVGYATSLSAWIYYTQRNRYNDTAAITSLKFITANGTFSGGTIYIYGVK
jgi:hypothetical protein